MHGSHKINHYSIDNHKFHGPISLAYISNAKLVPTSKVLISDSGSLNVNVTQPLNKALSSIHTFHS